MEARPSPHNQHLRTCTNHTTGTSTTLSKSNWESQWSADRMDHEKQHLRNDRNVDDLVDGLQLRKIRSFQHSKTSQEHDSADVDDERGDARSETRTSEDAALSSFSSCPPAPVATEPCPKLTMGISL